MELREYWNIVRRRAWLVVLLTLLAFVASWSASTNIGVVYQSTVRLAVKPQAEPRPSIYYSFSYDEYYSYVASELLIDDLIEVIKSAAFRDEVLERLQGKVAGSALKGIDGKKMHRVLMVNVAGATPEAAQLVAETIATLLTAPENKYISGLSWQNQQVTIVDPARTVQLGESRKYLDTGLRTALGLLAGIGLAFVLEYLDATIAGSEEVERLVGLRVLGEIPRSRKGSGN